ncbi:hypothetical protein CAPTEDRAFT_228268 [Capitella teleta]|uniref:non-specific protein-tyrosine kinase n=1 Tax=Capitella teleta TaxID=283909 RepID=R7TKV1_CAPTE|nr:hypothetical protein CAPTEDRAFT_228268 [Capitella teleta]|eukprot:ELT92181.1 hypothetical protein CAPTEDRAFT_228268 [Capitella teleta]
MSASSGPQRELLSFLQDAELEHYHAPLVTQLRVTSVGQFKYVEDEDLMELGMTRPEVRRLKKYFKKECPQGAIGKLKKIWTTKSASSSAPIDPPGSPGIDKPPPSPRPSSRHIIPADHISASKTIGKGDFGDVQQGVWTTEAGDRVQVALKCVDKEKLEVGMAEFLKEATALHALEHDHIVLLYGIVLGNSQLTLVTELAPLRSLLECIKEPALRASFTVQTLCDFAYQIADGMSYLENKRVIHRDLAARNVLVFTKDKVKISDFGLSKALGMGKEYYQANLSVNLKLPIAWLAPECINFMRFTSASDVWSFGVTLYEMFSYGFQPWAALTGDQNDFLGNFDKDNSSGWQMTQKVLEAIDEPNCQRLEQPECCPADYYQLMLKCWYHDPSLRPKFTDLLSSLSQMKPERMQAFEDCSCSAQSEYLPFKANSIITVLDKRPDYAPVEGLWKGALDNGKSGYFNPSLAAPYIEVKTSLASPVHKKNKGAKVSRRESARRSKAKPEVKKLDVTMIGRPQKDLRHMGHIGYDGAVFGDVAFIGKNYDKLPVKVTSTHRPSDEMAGSTISLPVTERDRCSMVSTSTSQLSFNSCRTRTDADSIATGISDSDTLTDVSSVLDDNDGFMRSKSEDRVLDGGSRFDDFNTGEDFGDFKLPDLSSGLDLDLGPSFMDEVMKALQDPKPESEQKDKSPLLQKEEECTFDNMALTSRDDLTLTSDDLKDSGIVEASFASLDISDASSKVSDEGTNGHCHVEEGEVKRRRPKLKLIMPGSRSDSSKEKSGIKPLSASDERKIDAAIELAAELASRQSMDRTSTASADSAGDTPCAGEEEASTWSRFTRSSTANKQPERKTYTEELASLSTDMNEAVTPEAQEAYNLLVGKGSAKEKSSFQALRERRSLRQQQQPVTTERASLRNGHRSVNMNLRKPQGIPVRGAKDAVTPTEGAAEEVNPLRRLRESTVSNGGGANLNANAPFFAKLKEQEAAEGMPVVPPRVPFKKGVLNAKPPQRKHPLVMPSSSSSPQSVDRPASICSCHDLSVNVKAVTASARDLGILNGQDSFWSESVNFRDLAPCGSPQDEWGAAGESSEEDSAPIPGRYKTSDTVSYEDLMEFALDGPVHPRGSDYDTLCDEVRLMRRVLSKDITVEDCMYSLEETGWEVHNAIKLLKLKQLLSTQLAEQDRCKMALMRAHWSIDEAASYLLTNTPGSESPELVHV